ncbi:unnamed protein product, partial [Caretta caretta]
IDECRTIPDICSPNATYINTNGSYRCEYRAGYVPSNRNTTLCQDHAPCNQWGGDSTVIRPNAPPAVLCVTPPPRFPLSDIDECCTIPDICGPNATCINTIGSYRCEFWAGYVPSNRCQVRLRSRDGELRREDPLLDI